MENLKVNSIQLHTPIFITGLGEFPTHIPSHTKTLDFLSMYTRPEGILVHAMFRGARASTIIPWGTVKIANLAVEPSNFTFPASESTLKVVNG